MSGSVDRFTDCLADNVVVNNLKASSKIIIMTKHDRLAGDEVRVFEYERKEDAMTKKRYEGMIENDTWYRCNICGREGRVGRCCSDEDRTPLNALAKAEQERIKGAKNTEQQIQPNLQTNTQTKE